MDTFYFKEAMPDGSFNYFSYSGMSKADAETSIQSLRGNPVTEITKADYDAAMAALAAARS